MKKIRLLMMAVLSAMCCSIGSLNADVLFESDFVSIPDAFAGGDLWGKGVIDDAGKEENRNGIIFGAGPYGQRINFNNSQSANEFGSEATAYVAETEADNGATNGAFSMIKTVEGDGGGYVTLPAQQGPFKVTVWNASGNANEQKFDVYFGDNLAETVTIVANKLIKKTVLEYTGTENVAVKFVTSSDVPAGKQNLYFYNVLVESVAPPTAPTISLTSTAATTAQEVLPNVAINPIIYRMGGTANSASVTWDSEPAGITVQTTGNTVTISGTPTTIGTYRYSITATDGTNTTEPLTGTVRVKPATKPLIAFVTSLAPTDPLLEGDNNIIEKLKESYEVVKIDGANGGTDYTPYAAIVMSGVPGSGGAGLAELKNFSKPFVNLKTWMFRSDRWNWGTADNVPAASLEEIVNTVVVTDASHDVFKGMSLADGSDIVIATNSSNAALRVLIPIFAWNDGNEANVTTLATVKGSDQDGKTVIGEIAVGSTMSGTPVTQKNIFIGVSEAAGPYFTPEYLTIVKNAVDYVLEGGGNSIDTEKADNSGKVEVDAEYYDLMGRAISGKPKGIVIKKSIYEDGTYSFGKAYYTK